MPCNCFIPGHAVGAPPPLLPLVLEESQRQTRLLRWQKHVNCFGRITAALMFIRLSATSFRLAAFSDWAALFSSFPPFPVAVSCSGISSRMSRARQPCRTDLSSRFTAHDKTGCSSVGRRQLVWVFFLNSYYSSHTTTVGCFLLLKLEIDRFLRF